MRGLVEVSFLGQVGPTKAILLLFDDLGVVLDLLDPNGP